MKRNGVAGYSFYTLQLFIVILAHSQGRLRRLAGRPHTIIQPEQQSKYSNRTVTAVVKKDICRRVEIFVVYLVANQAYCTWL